jgi:hypothetical protein
VPGVVDNISGLISIVAGAYLDIPPGPSGNGVLAYIEFVLLDPGGDPGFTIDDTSTTAVAEPATCALLVGGLAAHLFIRRKRALVWRHESGESQ